MDKKLADAILSVLIDANSFFEFDGTRFEAVTESDLMRDLRERGWKLPASGWFLDEVRRCGFKVKQGYQYPNGVRRAFRDGRKGRKLADYQTIIFLA